jgi:PAS domain S-box-containing protein
MNHFTLHDYVDHFDQARMLVISQWVEYQDVASILSYHAIDKEFFIEEYANSVFNYFLDVINGKVAIGDCPVMTKLLEYLKDKNISSQELFVICSHFKRAMVDISYAININSKEIFDEISYIFDQNFAGVLTQYSQTIYEKEIEINKNVELLQQYIDALNESALVSKTDEKGVITHINDKFINLCGYELSELVGHTHNVIRHPDMSKSFFKKMWGSIQKGKIFHGTIKNKKKKGGHFFIETTIVPIKDPFTEKQEYIAIGNEVTKLIDAKQQALDANKAKDYFLSTMSHEIRTPLNAIIGFVSLLQEEHLPSRHRRYLDIVHESGENLLNLINDILDFSKLRSGEFTIEQKVFNLEEILAKIIELLVVSANNKQVALLSYIDPLMPAKILCDPLRIQQIVSNFLSNAIKFTPSHGTIEIEATIDTKRMLKISVQDSGVGIAKEHKDKIFEPFSQIKSDTTINYGTGLGLSICKQLAELLGGSIALASSKQNGSTFTLEIPVKVVEKEPLNYDCKLLKNITIAFLQTKNTNQKKLKLIQNYYRQIGIVLHTITDVEVFEYDLLYFIDTDIDDTLQDIIISKKRPAISLRELSGDRSVSVPYISHLTFPIYLKKLRDSALETLGLKEMFEIKMQQDRSQKQHFDAYVLVAEDNEANQELIKVILEKHGIKYDLVANGADAVRMFTHKRYDLVFIDDQMPIKDGFKAVKEMLAYEKKFQKQHTPFVALTANLVNNAKKNEMMRVCDEFLGKPIILDALEKIFVKYLVRGKDRIDITALQDALDLDEEQLQMLLDLYIKKMDEMLASLQNATCQTDFKKMAKFSHSIKGSSSNFRMYAIQNYAAEFEKQAHKKDIKFEYETVLQKIVKEYKKIKETYEEHYSI